LSLGVNEGLLTSRSRKMGRRHLVGQASNETFINFYFYYCY
jgi:hypothetical protein